MVTKTRVQFNLKGLAVNNVKIQGTTDEKQKRTVIIDGDLGGTGGLTYTDFQRTDGNEDLKSADAVTAPKMIKTETGNVGFNRNQVRRFKIICKDEDEAAQLIELLQLRIWLSEKKDDNTASTDKFPRFWIDNVDYDEDKTRDVNDATSFMVKEVTNDTLVLNTSDKSSKTDGNGFNGLENVKISSLGGANGLFTDGDDPNDEAKQLANHKFKKQRATFDKVWKTFDSLFDYYKDKDASLRAADWSSDATSALSILKDVKSKAAAGGTNYGEVAVYNNVAEIKKRVDYWIKLLEEFRTWKDSGVDSIAEILKINANGYTISSRVAVANSNVTVGANVKNDGSGATDAGKVGKFDPTADADNIAAIKAFFSSKKYRDFDITFSDQKCDVEDGGNVVKGTTHAFPTNAHERIEIGSLVFAASPNFTKSQIDDFRVITEFDGETDSKDCRGFSPADTNGLLTVTAADNVTIGTKNIVGADKVEVKGWKADGSEDTSVTKLETYEYKELTKNCFLILNETDLENVVKIAFLNNTFDEVNGKNWSELRELYYYVARSEQMTVKYGGATNKTNKNRIDKCNEIAKGFTDILIEVPADESAWNVWKDKLNKYITDMQADSDGDKKEFGKFWGGSQMQYLSEIINRKKTTKKSPSDNKKFNKATELTTAKDAEAVGSEGKKVYEEFEKLPDTNDKKTDDVFNNLETLINELKNGADNEDKDKPEEWKNKYASGDGKTAWEFVDEHTKDGFDKWKDKGWATKIAEDAVKKLTDARAAAKTKMDGETDAPVKTEIDSQASIKAAKAIGDLFGLCKRAHGTVSSSEWDKLKSDLKAYKDSTSGEKKIAWDQVNKYKKAGDTKNYADESWEKAEKGKEKRDGNFSEAKKQETVQDVYKYSTAEDTKLDKDDRALAEAYVALKKETGDKAKLLTKIFGIEGVSEYSDDKDKLDKSLTDIESHIKALEELIKAKDTDTDEVGKAKKKLKEIESVDSEFKIDTFLNSLKSKLESRKAELETKKKEEDKQEGPGKNPVTPWWKEWYGILSIIVGVLVVIGIIAWLIKANSSEEGEGENE